jgi:hypothetical protein
VATEQQGKRKGKGKGAKQPAGAGAADPNGVGITRAAAHPGSIDGVMVGEGWEAFRYQGGLQEYVAWMNKVRVGRMGTQMQVL